MNALTEFYLMQLLVKFTIVLLIAWLAYWLLARQNPRWQVWLWRTCSIGLLLILAVGFTKPLYEIPLVTIATSRFDDERSSRGTTGLVDDTPIRSKLMNTTDVARPLISAVTDDAMQMRPETQRGGPSRSIPSSETRPDRRQAPFLQPEAIHELRGAGANFAMRSSWKYISIALYVIVIICLFARLVLKLLRARRIVQRSVESPTWVTEILKEIRFNRLRTLPSVRISNEVSSPIQTGLWRQSILLPNVLLQSSTAAQDVRASLAHELSHAENHDLAWDVGIAIVSFILWPHPLFWFVRSCHRAACERVSDRAAVDVLGNANLYQQLLAKIALNALRVEPGLGMAMARKSKVRKRLLWIPHCPAIPNLGRRGLLLSSLFILLVLLLGIGTWIVKPNTANAQTNAVTEDPVPDSQEQSPNASVKRNRPEKCRITVVRHDNSTPVVNAKIEVHFYAVKQNTNLELTTDESGVANFEYPDGDAEASFWLQATHSGLVPYYVGFGRELKPNMLPIDKIIAMEPGKKVGGTLVDKSGQPVAGANVSILVPAIDSPTPIHYHLLNETTGEDGRWELDGAPLSIGGLSIRAEHPKFIKAWFSVQDRQDGKYTLDAGLVVKGHVTNPNGQPNTKAHLSTGQDRWGSMDEPIKVDEQGNFVIYGLKPEPNWLTVEAPGFSPMVKRFDSLEDGQTIDFQLEKGKVTHFQFANSEGEPVKGIRIAADTWNGMRTLWWKGVSNEQGMVTWRGAPTEPVKFVAYGGGYTALRDIVAEPRDQPHRIELRRPLKIIGIVTDTQKNNIPEFKMSWGAIYSWRKEIVWDTNRVGMGKDGQVSMTTDESHDKIFLRIEAPGFRPWVSEAIATNKPRHNFIARLEQGVGPSGLVLEPDGKPAIGAQLTLVTESEGMQFTSNYQPSGGKQTLLSNDSGAFAFPAVEEESLIVAVHKSGYAEVRGKDVEKDKKIQLQPWAQIDIEVMRGKDPAANIGVKVDPDYKHGQIVRIFSYGIDGQTNEHGFAHFNRVVPGKVYVASTLTQPMGRGFTIYPERTEELSIAPGETVRVKLGGSGGSIAGKIELQGKPPAEHSWVTNEAITISSATSSDAQATKKFYGSKKSSGAQAATKFYRCLIGKDGSFSMHDLPIGLYDLRCDITAMPDPNQCGSGARIGQVKYSFEIKRDFETVDLGAIEATWIKRIGAGEDAPPFVAEGLRREVFQLSELRGRLVLIDFWATWCGPCMAEMPKLGEIHHAFADDDRVRVVGLSLDQDLESALAAVEKHQWPWMLGYVGPGIQSQVPQSYEVEAIPLKFLIDVDGKILYRGKDLDEIASIIKRRLNELSRNPVPLAEPTAGQSLQESDLFVNAKPISLAAAIESINYGKGQSEPTRIKPGLKLWSQTGEVIRSDDEVGTSGWLCGPQRMAVDPNRDRLYFADTLASRLVAYNRMGKRLFSSLIPKLHAMAVDEANGDIWCLTLQSLDSGSLIVLDTNGVERNRYPITGFAIAYSPFEDAFWIAGKSISKVSRDGKISISHPLPSGAYTVGELTVDSEKGGVFALEIDHPDVPRSANQIWRVTTDQAKVIRTFDKHEIPRKIAWVGRGLWVVAMTTAQETVDTAKTKEDLSKWTNLILRFDEFGNELDLLELNAADIAVGKASGEIWIRMQEEIRKLESDGTTSLTIPIADERRYVQIIAF